MNANQFFATFSNGSGQTAKPAAPKANPDRPVSVVDSFIAGEWRKLATWSDGSVTSHLRYEVYPTRQNGAPYSAPAPAAKGETPEQRNRRAVAAKLANVLREKGITPSQAALGGEGDSAASKCFRMAVTAKARCRSQYDPSPATWALAVEILRGGR